MVCPKCENPVRLGKMAPENTEVAARGAAFARWKQAHCQVCGVTLEIVPWTKWLAISIWVAAMAAGVVGWNMAVRKWPDSALLNALTTWKSLQFPELLVVWFVAMVLLRLLAWKIVRLRVGYDPQDPLGTRQQ